MSGVLYNGLRAIDLPAASEASSWRSALRLHSLRALIIVALMIGVLACTTQAPQPPATQPDAHMEPAPAADTSQGSSVPRPVPVLRVATGPLVQTFSRLQEIEETRQGQLSILHLGDSHVASDTMTGELRRLLQGRFGAAGRGFTQPGKPWKRWRQEGTRAAMSSGWRVHHGMKRDATGPHGISGIRIDADKLGEWVERADEQPFVRVIVHVLRGPNTGRITIYADGKPAATLPTMVEDATLPPHASALTVEVPQGARAVRVELVGDGPVSLLGIATQSAAPGVRYESIGLNGARAYTYLGFDAAIQRADVEAIAPDLIVLGLGTNEAYNLRNKPLTAAVKADLVRGFAGLIERVRAGAPQADCLILLPMDLVERPRDPSCFVRERVKKGRKRVWVTRLRDDIDPLIEPQCAWTSPESLALTSAASREAATQQQCAIWDQRLAQGGPTALYTWANMRPQLAARDGVHLTLNGYRALARGLFDDLSAAYLRHKRGEDGTLDTTPLTPPAPGLPTMEDEPAGPIDDELFGIY